jgi:uncharacterized membrane protein
MSSFYKNALSGFLRVKMSGDLNPILWAVGILYLLIPMGVMTFVHPRVSHDNVVPSALGYGFLFGIILYGIYDFTNYSLLKDWPLSVTLVDTLWGGILCATVSVVSAWVRFKLH